MLDLRFVRENPEVVKQNIKNKFQDHKLPLVDEVIELDADARKTQQEADDLRAKRNQLSKEIGKLMGQGKKEEAEAVKAQVAEGAARLAELEEKEKELQEKVNKIMMTIPNIIDPSVPIGKDDSCNVEIEKYGEPVVPDFEIPYHTEIMERFNGIDLDAAAKVAGNGFYYLMGDIARLHSSVISYARDFMIDRGFTYVIPPFMIRSNVVTGVMSFDEMDAMMYKIEGEDLYLIGTSEHSMIGKFIDTINDEEKLPYTLTSYSPCFRKEKGAHGIEERGVYRIHQFEKQEMIVVCKPEESMKYYDQLWQNTVDLFRSLDIPVRTLECCSGDLADLKVKSCDVEAWSPQVLLTNENGEPLSDEEIAKLIPTFLATQERMYEERIRKIGERYGSRVDSWDIVNESATDFDNFGRKAVRGKPFDRSYYGPMPADYACKSFMWAEKYLSKSAWFNINDYNMGPFFDQVKDLVDNGARIDVVGSQMHLFNPAESVNISRGEFSPNAYRKTHPDGIRKVFETLSQANRPIHLSEITITAPDNSGRGQMVQAVITRNLYRAWFAVEKMNGITWWNVVDDCGAPGEPSISGIFTRDMRPKTVYHALNDLIHREWKTQTTVKVTDGKVSFRGVRGRYHLTWKNADGTSGFKSIDVK